VYLKIITTLPKATYNEEMAHTTARTADSLEDGINVDGKGGSRIGDDWIKWERGGRRRRGRRHVGGQVCTSSALSFEMKCALSSCGSASL